MADLPSLPSLFLALTTRERVVVVIGVLALVVAWAAVMDAGEAAARADRAEADLAIVCAPPNAITTACTTIRLRGIAARR
jgi:cytochrome bd-type quinol oxidase subunit 2